MNNRDQIMLDFYREQLINTLLTFKRRKHFPVWGEIFESLHQIRALAHKYQDDVHVYDLYPTGVFIYSMDKKMFAAKIEDLHMMIYMDMDECIDSLLSGRFSPYQRK